MGQLAYWPADTSQPVLDVTTGDLLRAAAADAGTQTALVEVAPPGSESLTGATSTSRRWTYAELLAEAERGARWLLTRFSPGERITIWAPNIPEWVILQYAAALAGIVIVTANPALREPELRYVLIMGGGATIASALNAGLADALTLHLAPVVLGAGTPLFTGGAPRTLVRRNVIPTTTATHLAYDLL